jgi:hypothetical protein
VALALSARPAEADAPSYARGDWHVELRPARELTAVFHERVVFPHLEPRRWIVVASCPQALPWQELLACELKLATTAGAVGATGMQERQPPGRRYLRVMIPGARSTVAHGYVADASYRVRLLARHLLPGKPAQPAPPLEPGEQRRLLASTSLITWDRGPLEAWIHQRGLTRRGGESTVAFAWRIAQTVRTDYKYGGQDWDSAHVCNRRMGTCEGLSSVIVGTLRANGIPARLDLGFWVSKAGAHAAEYHVRLEFYAPEAGGWIPVDGSGLVTWSEWEPAFGHDTAQFLAVQVETGVRVDTGAFGTQEVVQLQRPAAWAVGTGTFKDEDRTPTVTVEELHP